MGTGRIVNDLGCYRKRLLKSCRQEAVVAWGEVENAFWRYLGDEITGLDVRIRMWVREKGQLRASPRYLASITRKVGVSSAKKREEEDLRGLVGGKIEKLVLELQVYLGDIHMEKSRQVYKWSEARMECVVPRQTFVSHTVSLQLMSAWEENIEWGEKRGPGTTGEYLMAK